MFKKADSERKLYSVLAANPLLFTKDQEQSADNQENVDFNKSASMQQLVSDFNDNKLKFGKPAIKPLFLQQSVLTTEPSSINLLTPTLI